MTAPGREDFERWQDDPVTRWVMRGLLMETDVLRAQWISTTWDAGVTNPKANATLLDLLRELRATADAYSRMAEAHYANVCYWNKDEPNDE